MIITEQISERLKKTVSDSGYKIRKVGTNEIYSEAVDIIGNPYQYEETNEKIEEQQEVQDAN